MEVGNGFTCPVDECDYSSHDWRDIELHTEEQHELESDYCHICKTEVFLDIDEHDLDFHESDRTCPFCEDGKEFPRYAAMNDHIQSVHDGLIGSKGPLIPVTQQSASVTLLEKMREFYQGPDQKLILKNDYIVMFDTARNRVVFACKTLTPNQIHRHQDRVRLEDYDYEAEVPDYIVCDEGIWETEHDMGHLVAAADCSYSQDAFESTYNMANVSPMTENLNNGMWSALEVHNRKVGKQCNSLTYFAIPIYDDDTPPVEVPGGALLDIPVAFAKISYLEKPDEPIQTSQAFIMPNSQEIFRESFWKYRVNHQQFEERTRLKFKQVPRTWE